MSDTANLDGNLATRELHCIDLGNTDIVTQDAVIIFRVTDRDSDHAQIVSACYADQER